MNRRLMTLSPAWWLAVATAGLLAGALPWLASVHPLLGLGVMGGLAALLVLVMGWPFSAVALLIVAAVFTRYRVDVGPVTVRAEQVAAVAVAGLGVLQLGLRRGRLRTPPAVWFATLWWLMNMISALFFSLDRASAVQDAVRVGLGVLTFVLILNLIPNQRHWRWAVALFLAVGVAEAAFGILARALYPAVNLGIQVSWNYPEPIPYGTFEEGNLFGSHTASWALVVLTLVLTLGRGALHSSKGRALLAGLAILLVALLLSLSRGAWLMFAAGAALIWMLYRRSAWHQANRFLLLLVAAPFTILFVLSLAPLLPASVPFAERLQSFLRLSTDPTFSARLSDWSMAWNDWLQQPLTGWGPGSFADIHGEIRARPAWISNLTLRLLQETGALGFLAFLLYLFFLLLPVWKIGRMTEKRLDRAALLGLGLSYLALIGVAYQSTDGIWLAASWVHAGLIAAGTRVLNPTFAPTSS
ncbi:MAG: O-antigen ligase family protein [Chloroflexi bacterium]|nr:O-antigen ligase family protein [Chloroflexota bacterium]